ncbi:hypothetical protein MKX03_031022 [Papaver bracteatum]|nr:hypothetical protein MKX03_031022 [Papaver bracteatum]
MGITFSQVFQLLCMILLLSRVICETSPPVSPIQLPSPTPPAQLPSPKPPSRTFKQSGRGRFRDMARFPPPSPTEAPLSHPSKQI